MTFDPYEALGVERDASEADVDAAFKRAAKQTHPDAGGTAEAFNQVKRAHLVLSSPDRRAEYDRTGKVDGDPADTADQVALNMIGALLGMFLTQDKDPFRDDLAALMVRHFLDQKEQIGKAIVQMERAESRARRMKKRFTRKGEGENMLARMLDWKEREATEAITAHRRQQAICDRAIEMLKDYRFVRDQPDYSLLQQQAGTAYRHQQAPSWHSGLGLGL